jgi:hypothetical protein
MNNSIAIIKNCQRNCLRKMAALPRNEEEYRNFPAERRTILDNAMRDLKDEKVRNLLDDVAGEYGIVGIPDGGDDYNKAFAWTPAMHEALQQSKIKAYAPWAVGGALAGGGLGGWIGKKYGSTLLGVLLGGVGGGAAGWAGKSLYEKYFNDDRYNKALRATGVIKEMM